MKIRIPIIRWLVTLLCLCAGSTVVLGAELTLSDTWRGTSANYVLGGGRVVETTGSFSANISLPLNGANFGHIMPETKFMLWIGTVGVPGPLFSYLLGEDPRFTSRSTSATFPIVVDGAYNSHVTNGSITVAWTSTTVSVTASSKLDVLEEESYFEGLSSLDPPLNSHAISGVNEVIVQLGNFSYDNQQVWVTGYNAESLYWPGPPASIYEPLETGSLKWAADFTPPVVAITSPAHDGTNIYDAATTIQLAGAASDNLSLASISCFLNGDTNQQIGIDQASQFPTNKIKWTASLDLKAVGRIGTNTITVVAADTTGNKTSTTRAVFWSETNVVGVSINPPGAGTVRGLVNRQQIHIGVGYPVTASPADRRWIFSEWTEASGDVLSTNVTFEFADETSTLSNSSPATLIANFVANPFANSSLAGTYRGLFSGNTNGTLLGSGYITLSVTRSGVFSGKLNLAAKGSPIIISGELSESPDGSLASAELAVQVNKTTTLVFNLEIGTGTGSVASPAFGGLAGSISILSATNSAVTVSIEGGLSE